MKKILALIFVLALALSSVTAFAALEDYNIATFAETHKVIFDTDRDISAMTPMLCLSCCRRMQLVTLNCWA